MLNIWLNIVKHMVFCIKDIYHAEAIQQCCTRMKKRRDLHLLQLELEILHVKPLGYYTLLTQVFVIKRF